MFSLIAWTWYNVFNCPTIHNSSLRPSHTCLTLSKITLLYIFLSFFSTIIIWLEKKKKETNSNICMISLHTKVSQITVLKCACETEILKESLSPPHSLSLSHTHTHTHTHTNTFPQGDVEEISCDPSSSPFSFHFLYLPDGKQLTAITSLPLHTFTHRLVFISLPLTANAQTLNLILIVSKRIKQLSSCGAFWQYSCSQNAVFNEDQIDTLVKYSSIFSNMLVL